MVLNKQPEKIFLLRQESPVGIYHFRIIILFVGCKNK